MSRSTIYDPSTLFRAALLCPLLCALLPVLFGLSVCMARQPASSPVARIVVDGNPWNLPPGTDVGPPATPSVAADAVLEYLHDTGFFAARLDSVSETDGRSTVFVTSGMPARVASLRIEGVPDPEGADLRKRLHLEPGSTLDLHSFKIDAASILANFAVEGRHMATIAIQEMIPASADSLRFDLTIRVEPGPLIPVSAVQPVGTVRTSARFISHLVGVGRGDVIRASELAPLASRIVDTDAFRSVGVPRLEIGRDSTAVLVIPLEEGPPGSFDLVLGYLPAVGSGKASIVGSGHLSLVNPFGFGRELGLKLDRRPGQVSSADVRIRDPLLASLPIRLEASFGGLQQDSTFNRRRWSVSLGYGLLPGVEVNGRYSVEATRPGSAGLRLRGSRQRIPRSDGSFWGLGVRVRRLDRSFNPRSGIYLESLVENGRETERFREILPDADTMRVARSVRQERLQIATRGYLPIFGAQVLVFGADAMVLLSDVVDESDLFRFGGASSLRGYDEDRFLASTAVRLLAEYRILLDAVSHAFAFIDLGYVEKPEIADIPAASNWYPGFGLGMQYQTAAGIVSVSYAMNDRDGVTNGRVHFGISFGL
jgi:outer membrane protein assembly factor BamA